MLTTNRNSGLIAAQSAFPNIAPPNDDFKKLEEHSNSSLIDCNDDRPSSEILKALLLAQARVQARAEFQPRMNNYKPELEPNVSPKSDVISNGTECQAIVNKSQSILNIEAIESSFRASHNFELPNVKVPYVNQPNVNEPNLVMNAFITSKIDTCQEPRNLIKKSLTTVKKPIKKLLVIKKQPKKRMTNKVRNQPIEDIDTIEEDPVDDIDIFDTIDAEKYEVLDSEAIGFDCEHCGCSFIDYQSLHTHRYLLHRYLTKSDIVSPYCCVLCGKRSSTQRLMISHMVGHSVHESPRLLMSPNLSDVVDLMSIDSQCSINRRKQLKPRKLLSVKNLKTEVLVSSL